MSAAYRLRPRPGQELLAAALEAAREGEFSLLWVTRPWSFDEYAIGTEATADVRHANRAALAEYLDAQRPTLEERAIQGTPEVYLLVDLTNAWAAGEVEAERRVRRRLLRWEGCERASEADLRRLIRRADAGHRAFVRLDIPPDGAGPGGAATGEKFARLEVRWCRVDIAFTASAAPDADRALRFTLSVRIVAASPAQLERRIAMLRAELAPVPVRREPGGGQGPWTGGLPAQGAGAPHPDRARLPELGAGIPHPV
ncbi:MAG: hypothetical protein ACRDWD_10205, partial [Acidimicrobiia bacterium]